ncbi:hypothetical protein CG51_05560 [Haematobacter missouriensis]|nr:hypothetical protein CG51_05560 [Haematobacter missouriensis]
MTGSLLQSAGGRIRDIDTAYHRATLAPTRGGTVHDADRLLLFDGLALYLPRGPAPGGDRRPPRRDHRLQTCRSRRPVSPHGWACVAATSSGPTGLSVAGIAAAGGEGRAAHPSPAALLACERRAVRLCDHRGAIRGRG